MSTFNVTYNADIQAIHVEMIGFLPQELYKKGWTEALALFRQHHCHRVLINIEDGKVISPENQHWLMEEYIPALEKIMHGKQVKQARIIHGDIFNKMSTSSLATQLQNVHSPLVLKDFDDKNAAIQWLVSE